MYTTYERRPCGRPTKSGAPCKATFSFGFACTLHATEHEQALVDAYQQGYRAGLSEGSELGRKGAEMSKEYLQRRVAELEKQLDQAKRRHTVDGHQAVEVDGYGYLWTGADPLRVGERVWLPENYVSKLKHGSGPFVGVVTALGTTYEGSLSRVLRRES